MLFSLIRKVMQACYNKLNITKIDGTESESATVIGKDERKESESAYKCISDIIPGPSSRSSHQIFSAHKLTLSFHGIGIIQ